MLSHPHVIHPVRGRGDHRQVNVRGGVPHSEISNFIFNSLTF